MSARISATVAGPVLALLMALAPAGAMASQAPDELVKHTANEVIDALENRKETLEQNPEKVFELVDRIVLPHFDFQRMSRLVLGQQWRKASEQQKKEFTEEFRRLLVNTYATALLDYSGQELRFKPFHGSEEGDATVRTEIVPDKGPPIPIDYALHRAEDGEWKVYDISVDGVSLVTNYRTSYQRLARNEGIDSLIAEIATKNEGAAAN